MSGLRVCLFGSPRIECDGRPVHIDRRKAIALLAHLAVTELEERRYALAALLWPAQDRQRALSSLRRALRSLTEAFQGRFLTANRKVLALERDKRVWVDVRQFESLLKQCPSGADEADGESRRTSLATLAQAVDLYGGHFLADFTLSDSEAFDEWQFLQGERYRRSLVKALEGLVSGHQALGDLEQAIDYARRWLALDPLVEEAHRRLMRLYAEAGERSQLRRQYERCVAVLKEQLDVSPEAKTEELYRALREGRQGAPGGGPETGTGRPSRPFSHNLPDSPTPFVGRESELDWIRECLEDPDCRLLTVVGPGGMGKTRLALEAARREIGPGWDGIYFVPLAASAPDLVVAAIGERLGLTFNPQGDPERQLLNHLHKSKILLLLDNFEHLVEKGGLVAAILKETRYIKVMITSRERLSLEGEWLLEIEGLSVPREQDSENAENYSAVQLFLQAAHRVRASFALSPAEKPAVIRICRLVGGMPLGIELSASWLRLISCQEIGREIQRNLDFLSTGFRDLPERHRSLRGVFISSIGLLSRNDRDVFRGLSVFRGGFDQQAALRVTGASPASLLNLADKSLLSRSASGRYEMHELLRQFALESLSEHTEAWRTVKRAHCQYYLELLAEHGKRLKGEKQQRALEGIRREIDNIRAGWRWAAEQGMAEILEEGLEGLYQFYILAGWLVEGEELLDSAVGAISGARPPLSRAKAAARQGRFCSLLGNYEKARILLQESLAIFRASQVEPEIALTLSQLGQVLHHVGEFATARKLAEESVALFRKTGDRHGTAIALSQLGTIAGAMGEYGKTRLLMNESLVIFEQLGDQIGLARCLNNLGNVAYLSGYPLEAIRLFQEALDIFRNLDVLSGMASCISNLGMVYEELEEHEKAKEYSQQGLELFKEIGYETRGGDVRTGPAGALENLGRATFGLEQYEESRRYFLGALKVASEIKAIPQALIAFIGLARLLAQQGDDRKAYELLVFVHHHPKANDEARIKAQEVLSQVKARLPAGECREAEKQGRKQNLRALAQEMLRDPGTRQLSA